MFRIWHNLRSCPYALNPSSSWPAQLSRSSCDLIGQDVDVAKHDLLSHSTLGRQAELKRLFRQSHVARGPNRKTLSILVRNGKLVQETLEHDLRNIMGKEATISKKRAVQRHVPRCTSELKRKR